MTNSLRAFWFIFQATSKIDILEVACSHQNDENAHSLSLCVWVALRVHFLHRNVSGKCDANMSNVLSAAQGGNVKGEIGSAPGVSAWNYWQKRFSNLLQSVRIN